MLHLTQMFGSTRTWQRLLSSDPVNSTVLRPFYFWLPGLRAQVVNKEGRSGNGPQVSRAQDHARRSAPVCAELLLTAELPTG